MTRLTEEMVVARAKVSDLSLIKKLNCWGSELTDVSILKRMRGVEVLALSVNKIASLQPFEECQKLQELYLRKNAIQDINEIAHLQNLPSLKYLWLEENPCCEKLGANYRAVVLRALPNLKKLDNIDVTEEEVNDALRSAGGDSPGAQEEDSYEDAYEQQQQQQQHQTPPQVQYQQHQAAQRGSHHSQHSQHSSGRGPSASPTKESPSSSSLQQQNASTENTTEESVSGSSKPASPQEQIHPTSPKYNQNTREHRMSLPQADVRALFMRQQSPGSDHDSPHAGHVDRSAIPSSISTQSMKEYYQSERPHHPPHYRHSQTDLTEWDEHPHAPHHNPYGSSAALHHIPKHPPYRNGYARENGEWEEPLPSRLRRNDIQPPSVSSAAFSQYAPFHRRPVSRSSNLLSAALCLVKELDYASLEVLEHAVRLRIEELSSE